MRRGGSTTLAFVAASAFLMSWTVFSPLLGQAASVGARVVAPMLAVAMLLGGRRIGRQVRLAVGGAAVTVWFGLLHGDVGQVGLFAAEMVAVLGVLVLLEYTDDPAEVLRGAFVTAALAVAAALIVATEQVQAGQHHVALGFVIGPGFGFLLGSLVFSRRRRWTLLGVVAVFFAAVSSGSRASLVIPVVATLLVVAVTARWSPGRKAVFAVAAVAVVMYVLPSLFEFAIDQAAGLPGVSERAIERQRAVIDLAAVFDEQSLQVRYFELWPATWRTIWEHPFGIGFGVPVELPSLETLYAHNVILEGGLAFGWLGMVAAAAFVVERLAAMVRLARTRPHLAAGGLAIVLGFMISGGPRNLPLLALTYGLVGVRSLRDPAGVTGARLLHVERRRRPAVGAVER